MTLTMYPPQVNSPQTSLTAGINAVQTSITVVDGSLLPAAPNILVLGDGNDAETILYTSKAGNLLSGITRGFQGTAKAFAPGTNVARYFTAYDQEAIQGNIGGHVGDFENPHDVTAAQVDAAPAAHATDVSNPHSVTVVQIGAAPSSHVNDSLNPHSVTAEQVGAVTIDNFKTVRMQDGFEGVRIEYDWTDNKIMQQRHYDLNSNLIKQVDYIWSGLQVQQEVYILNTYNESNVLVGTNTITVVYSWTNDMITETEVIAS